MNSRIDSEKLLSIWEDCWGKLNPEWTAKFLNDPRVEKILTFPALSILNAVQNRKKMDEILELLESALIQPQSKTDPVGDDLDKPVTHKRKSLGTDSEVNTIYEWLVRMSVAQFDPESTFPRLIIKSNKETCQTKRKYKTEKEAILALVKLEELKGELIKQLPYRCNICGEFHNTHLISRETIQKLMRKYRTPKFGR
jgi:hypothetical protein